MNGPVRFEGGHAIVKWSLVAAAIGAVALVIGGFFDAAQSLLSYLTMYAYLVSVAVGALLFLMICFAMRAGWPTLLRRLVEATTSTLPLLAVLFVPIALGLVLLYPWMRPETIADDHARALIAHKKPYLDGGFFIVRTAVYFAIWIVAAWLLQRWSVQKDEKPESDVAYKMTALSAGMLPPVGLAMSFAAFDWLMSLTPTWFSTMFPVYYFAGGFVAAIALLTVLTFAVQRAGLLPGVNASHYYALGRLLLAFTIFWAYAAFFQFFIIWMANKPVEVAFFLPRMHGAWGGVSVALIATHFVVPFFVLLLYRIKREPRTLTAVAAWLLVAHYIDIHWIVMPSGRPAPPLYGWRDLAAILALGGVSLAFAVWRVRGLPTVPIHDPELPRALQYESV